VGVVVGKHWPTRIDKEFLNDGLQLMPPGSFAYNKKALDLIRSFMISDK
jgi:hypothetical protein